MMTMATMATMARIVGRAPRTSNLWVATGFNSLGIQLGPGIGLALADWMAHGEPSRTLAQQTHPLDFAELDVRRFHPEHCAGAAWQAARALEGYATEYGVRYPGQEFATDPAARGVRLSPLHQMVAEAGAVFGSVGGQGWERPLHYEPLRAGAANAGASVLSEEHLQPSQHLAFNARKTSW